MKNPYMRDQVAKYFEPTLTETRWGVAVAGLGEYTGTTGKIPESGRSIPYHILVCILGGKGVLYLSRDVSKRVGPGTIIWVQADEWHRYHPDTEIGCWQMWVNFEGWYASGLARRGVLGPPIAVLKVADFDTVQKLMATLLKL